ncbi:hypothetical protein GGTG_06597 [Gaeumannomyces tritici R3-111a-1]|uniref:Ipa protein n=1 Tax=Gaeumannomyces tritici (strain R3-111a-1) TaxID=644352 RepID=J3NZ98_GAET3|nr:hypothetical protein GGTG_06597 [Gaeumannomyces tritici R3-111a-1]EJT76681.1 hypothetical protein GGTG_06597 [Gaeumannomyces tritici R3-111a-1]
MAHPKTPDLVRELHGDLKRKYQQHGARIEAIWRSLNRAQRERCIKAGAMDGVVLAHSLDQSLGNVCKFIPEWNLRDLAKPGSDFLLHLLKHRSTTSLHEQYWEGIAGGPGDHQLISEMMRTRGLRHVDSFKDCYTMFLADEQYGFSFEVVEEKDKVMATLTPAIQAGSVVPQATGELVLQRQLYTLTSLVIVIDDILEEGSKTRANKALPKKPDMAATAALAKMSIQPSAPRKLQLSDIVVSARDQRASIEEYLRLLSTEPVVLTHVVNFWFYSRPELVPDEKGRIIPVLTGKYLSAAVFDAVHSLVKGAAVWTYIGRLLDLLSDPNMDRVWRGIVLQEVSNICHLEYGRARSQFRRSVQPRIGAKWFKRSSNAYDRAGNARVSMKGSPEDLTRADPQLHYVLRLCQDTTDASKAVDWITKLTELHEAHPEERKRLSNEEADALSDLAAIIGFTWEVSPAISMPPLSRKKGQLFVSRSQDLEAELNMARKEVDLRDYVLPIDNLLEPGVAKAALGALDQFVVDKTGTKMGFLYQDLIEECLSDLQNQYQHIKAQTDTKKSTPMPAPTLQPTEKLVEERKQKEKTRPSATCAFELVATPEPSPPPPASPLKVASSTAEVFLTFFNKSESRGSVSWAAFEAAMSDLGFSVLPKFGSVYTFQPPEGMEIQRPLTLHRPHKSHVEGYMILVLARRLNRAYGWDQSTFEVA